MGGGAPRGAQKSPVRGHCTGRPGGIPCPGEGRGSCGIKNLQFVVTAQEGSEAFLVRERGGAAREGGSQREEAVVDPREGGSQREGERRPDPCSRGLGAAKWAPARLAEGSRGGKRGTSVLA